MTRTAPAAAPSTNGSPRRGTRVSPGPGRVPALDGLRGVAVLAVLAFHAWPVLFPGGFVGVDMFFVLSGFLITTGLVRRIDAGKGVGFGGFWMRRIRRLVPALVVALVGSTALAWLAFAEFPSGLRREWLGALTYSSNWLMIVDGNDYFNAATPPMFEHLWSLAIEEQFYVVWPPLILGLLLLLWPRGGTATAGRRVDMLRVGLVLLLAVASAVGMAIGQISGAPTTRMYFGTDTHAFGLLFGAAVSIWLAHVVHPAHPPAAAAGTTGTLTAPRSGPLRTLLVWAAFAVLVASFFVVDGTAPYVYLGVLAGLSALVAGLVFHVVQGDRQDAFSRAMSGRVLGWWGRRSYAAYLWHWPLLVIMRVLVPNDAAEWVEPLAAGGVLVLTALIAEASSRWIEEPILRRGFREAFSGWGRAVRRAWSTGAGKAAVAVGALLLVIVPVAAGAALLRSPSETKLQQEIAAAEDALRQAQAEQSTQATPSADAADPESESASGSSGAQGSDAAAPAEPSGPVRRSRPARAAAGPAHGGRGRTPAARRRHSARGAQEEGPAASRHRHRPRRERRDARRGLGSDSGDPRRGSAARRRAAPRADRVDSAGSGADAEGGRRASRSGRGRGLGRRGPVRGRVRPGQGASARQRSEDLRAAGPRDDRGTARRRVTARAASPR